MNVKHVERPLGTNDTAANGNMDSDNVERPFGTNCMTMSIREDLLLMSHLSS